MTSKAGAGGPPSIYQGNLAPAVQQTNKITPSDVLTKKVETPSHPLNKAAAATTDKAINSLILMSFKNPANTASQTAQSPRASLEVKETARPAAATLASVGEPAIMKDNYVKTEPNDKSRLSDAKRPTSENLQRAKSNYDKQSLLVKDLTKQKEDYESSIKPPNQATPAQQKELDRLAAKEAIAKYEWVKLGIEVLNETIKITNPKDPFYPQLLGNLDKLKELSAQAKNLYIKSSMTLLKDDVHALKESIQYNAKMYQNEANPSEVQNANSLIKKYEKLNRIYIITLTSQDKIKKNESNREKSVRSGENYLYNELIGMINEVRLSSAEMQRIPSSRPLPPPPTSEASPSSGTLRPLPSPPTSQASPSAGPPPSYPPPPIPTSQASPLSISPERVKPVRPPRSEAATAVAIKGLASPSGVASNTTAPSNKPTPENKIAPVATELFNTEISHQAQLKCTQQFVELFCVTPADSGKPLILKDTEFTKQLTPEQKKEFTKIMNNLNDSLKILQSFSEETISKFKQFEEDLKNPALDKNEATLKFAEAIATKLTIPNEVIFASARAASTLQDLEIFFNKPAIKTNSTLNEAYKIELSTVKMPIASGGGGMTTHGHAIIPIIQRMPRYEMLTKSLNEQVDKAIVNGNANFSVIASTLNTTSLVHIKAQVTQFNELKRASEDSQAALDLAKNIEKAKKNGGALTGSTQIDTKKHRASIHPSAKPKVKATDAQTLIGARKIMDDGIKAQDTTIQYLEAAIFELKTSEKKPSEKTNELIKLISEKRVCFENKEKLKTSLTALNSSRWAKEVEKSSPNLIDKALLKISKFNEELSHLEEQISKLESTEKKPSVDTKVALTNTKTKSPENAELIKLNKNKSEYANNIKETQTSLESLKKLQESKTPTLVAKAEQSLDRASLALNAHDAAKIIIEAAPVTITVERQKAIETQLGDFDTKFTELSKKISDTKIELAKAKNEIATAQNQKAEPKKETLDALATHLATLEKHAADFQNLQKTYTEFTNNTKIEVDGTLFEKNFNETDEKIGKSVIETQIKIDGNNFKTLWDSLKNIGMQLNFINTYRNVINKMEIEGKPIPGDTKSEKLFNLLSDQFKNGTINEKRIILAMTHEWLNSPINANDINPQVQTAIKSILDQVTDESSSSLKGLKNTLFPPQSPLPQLDIDFKPVVTTLKPGTNSTDDLLKNIATGNIKSKDYKTAVKSFAEDLAAQDLHLINQLTGADFDAVAMAKSRTNVPKLTDFLDNSVNVKSLAILSILEAEKEKPGGGAKVLGFFIDVQKHLIDNAKNSPVNLSTAYSLNLVFEETFISGRVISQSISKLESDQRNTLRKSSDIFKMGTGYQATREFVQANPGAAMPLQLSSALLGNAEANVKERVAKSQSTSLLEHLLFTETLGSVYSNQIQPITELTKKNNQQTYDIGKKLSTMDNTYQVKKPIMKDGQPVKVDGNVQTFTEDFDVKKFYKDSAELANNYFPKPA